MRKFIFLKGLLLMYLFSSAQQAFDEKNTQPLKTVIHFLKWYELNERIKSRSIIKGGGKDSSTFYSVDFKVADQYLVELKTSNFLSDKFLNDLYR